MLGDLIDESMEGKAKHILRSDCGEEEGERRRKLKN
jgi:hypothetical protein